MLTHFTIYLCASIFAKTHLTNSFIHINLSNSPPTTAYDKLHSHCTTSRHSDRYDLIMASQSQNSEDDPSKSNAPVNDMVNEEITPADIGFQLATTNEKLTASSHYLKIDYASTQHSDYKVLQY